MSFTSCQHCHRHYFITDKSCPHCTGGAVVSSLPTPKALGLLLGLGAIGCMGDSKVVDSSEEVVHQDSVSDTAVTVQPGHEPPYGVPDGDQDLDGYFESEDCDDSDEHTHPFAAENESNPEQCMTDMDGDGFGDMNAEGAVTPGTDCDDTNPAIHPAVEEVSGDGIDSNCDGDDDN